MRPNIGSLLTMLTYARPARSMTEAAFINRFIRPLGATVDPHGNYHLTIGTSPILWSSHTDTVHRVGGFQTVHYDGHTVCLSKRSKRHADCLGADDTAGVWLMTELIRAGVSGHYIFHAEEEIGGNGSSDLALQSPDLIAGIEYAIALDRKGTEDIITHQGFGQCCSDAFAASLARQLNRGGLQYDGSDRGVFTDTANYTDLVGECTNLSVGYESAHSSRESLNVDHLCQLLDALMGLDVSALVSKRLPGDDDTRWTYIAPRSWDRWSAPKWNSVAHTVKDEDDPVSIIDGEVVRSFRQSHFSDYCLWCGNWFMADESDAADFAHYCDRSCERCAAIELAESRQTTYLDPSYADVQASLRRTK
jgi:hypothetical protein